jgi:predicted cupin superfamily sugar epimerase
VRSAELWLWHRGGALTLALGGDADTRAEATELRLGPDVAAGEHPQLLVPAGVWQSAWPADARQVLVSCVVVPGFDFADFTLAE